ncbi:hypothetical protein DRO69_08580 [Candidatus Bathyarchaeota archaeon]|nr:MAG: hypothetical protein DRO69_08580 [Candidatus Bathyarchaeota archaeon]
MKSKLLAIVAILMLLIGVSSVVFTPAYFANAADTYVYLTIDYAPAGMPVPDTAPPVGVHNYTIGSKINITAPLIVEDGDVRYVFDNWTITYDGTSWSTTNNKHMVTMDQNKTATAYYKVQYLLTVITPYDVPNIWDSGVWYENTSSRWFDAGATAYAGVLKSSSVDYMVIDTYARAYFLNWTGDASGKTYYAGYFWTSDPITMDGPKTAIAEWELRYKLWTDSDSEYEPWGPGSNYYDPDKRGWYPDCTNVDLTAPSVTNENPGNWRWRFDHWLVERWNGSAWVPETLTTENITVHLGPGTKATAYFYLQYYLTVADSPGMLDTGLESYSGYYDYCSNVTITAPEIVPDPSDPGIRWVFDHWYLASVFDMYNTTVTVHIEHATTVGKTLYAIYTKEYYLEVNDNIGGLSCVSTQSGWFKPDTKVPLSAPCIIPVDSDTQYVFVEWVKDPGHWTDSNCNTTITMNGPRNATAYYKKQFKVKLNAEPQPPMEDLLTGFPKEFWWDANTYKWIKAPSGPIAHYPFDMYFDHWEVNGVPQTQYHNQIKINVSEPISAVAVYLGKSAFFMTPQTVIEDVPAECTTFDVNVTAANLVDVYAFDFKVSWDPSLIELVGVDVKVDEIWTSYFIAKSEWNNTEGWYWLVATSLDDYGFNGTATVVTLTFHVIYDPCYLTIDYYRDTPLTLTVNKLADHNANPLYPWNVHGSYYRINAIQPVLKITPDTITVSKKDATFTVSIEIENAIKLHDWHTIIVYPKAYIQAIDVAIDTTFLQGPYTTFSWTINHSLGYVYIDVVQADGAPLANGNGTLATITFQVIKSIFWTTSNPTLTGPIRFGVGPTYISVKCPNYQDIYPPVLGIVNAQYVYDPIPGDLNMDGVVNVLDLQLVAADYGSHTTYDLNGDSKVDLIDLVLVAINYGREEP